MFGQDRVGVEQTAAVERTFGYSALPFAEQVGQDALIRDLYLAVAVDDLEANSQIIVAHEAAGLHQSAEPDARARRDVLLRHVARRIEKHDGIAERVEHERNRHGEHADAAADQNEASPLAGHRRWFRDIASPSLYGPSIPLTMQNVFSQSNQLSYDQSLDITPPRARVL